MGLRAGPVGGFWVYGLGVQGQGLAVWGFAAASLPPTPTPGSRPLLGPLINPLCVFIRNVAMWHSLRPPLPKPPANPPNQPLRLPFKTAIWHSTHALGRPTTQPTTSPFLNMDIWHSPPPPTPAPKHTHPRPPPQPPTHHCDSFSNLSHPHPAHPPLRLLLEDGHLAQHLAQLAHGLLLALRAAPGRQAGCRAELLVGQLGHLDARHLRGRA